MVLWLLLKKRFLQIAPWRSGRKCGSRVKFRQSSHSPTFCDGPGVHSFVFLAARCPSQPFNVAAKSSHSQYIGFKKSVALLQQNVFALTDSEGKFDLQALVCWPLIYNTSLEVRMAHIPASHVPWGGISEICQIWVELVLTIQSLTGIYHSHCCYSLSSICLQRPLRFMFYRPSVI